MVSYTAALPVGKGKKWITNPGKAGPLLSGWEINGIYTAESGQPLFLGTSTNLTNSLGGGSRPNNGGRSAKLSGDPRGRLNRFFDTSVFSQPPAFTFGDRKSTRLNSSHIQKSRMPSSA